MPERTQYGGILTVAEIRRVGADILSRPERQRLHALDDLMVDAVAGIASGDSEDAVAMCQELCVVGGAVCKDPDPWLRWQE